MKKDLNKNQKGFSMFELLIYLAIVIGLTVIVYNLTVSARASAEANNVRQELDLFSIGAQNCYTRDRDLTSCDTDRLSQPAISPLRDTTTVCGDVWSITGSSSTTMTISYPLDSCNDLTNLGNDMASILSARAGYTNVGFNSPTANALVFTVQP